MDDILPPHLLCVIHITMLKQCLRLRPVLKQNTKSRFGRSESLLLNRVDQNAGDRLSGIEGAEDDGVHPSRRVPTKDLASDDFVLDEILKMLDDVGG